MVEDFWQLDQSLMTKENLIKTAKEYYSEDFIEDYDKWKENLKQVNEGAYDAIKHIVPKDKYIELTFDDLCSNILKKIEDNIIKFGVLSYTDIISITDSIYYDAMEKSVNEWENNKNSLNNLMDSIKKVVAIPINKDGIK